MAAVPDGAAVCPSCGAAVAGEVHRDAAVPVLMAFLLPVVGTVVVLSLLALIGFEGYRLIRRALPARVPAPVVVSQPTPPPRRSPVVPVVPKQSSADTDEVRRPKVPVVVPKATAMVMPEAPESAEPAPTLSGFLPETGLPGDALFIRGNHLDDVRSVLMISSHGAVAVNCVLLYQDTGSVTARVPDIRTGTDGIVIAAISNGGISVLTDQHTAVTPWDTSKPLKNTSVIVNTGDRVRTRDHVVVMAAPGSEVSLGDDCVAFLADHVKLTSRGQRCKIYYVGPLMVSAGVSTEGMIAEPSIEVSANSDAFKISYVRPGPVETTIPGPQ
jgi:hypothetical protein